MDVFAVRNIEKSAPPSNLENLQQDLVLRLQSLLVGESRLIMPCIGAAPTTISSVPGILYAQGTYHMYDVV